MERSVDSGNQRKLGNSDMDHLNPRFMESPQSRPNRAAADFSPLYGPIQIVGPTNARMMDLGSDGENDPILADEGKKRQRVSFRSQNVSNEVDSAVSLQNCAKAANPVGLQLVHEGLRQSIHMLSTSILAHVTELNIVGAINLSSLPPIPVKWSPPASGTIKFNFDSSFLSATKEAFFGVIARNSSGLIMAACIIPHSYVNDVFIAEAKACESAVTFALELGFRCVHVEGDSLTVIRKLSSAPTNKSIIQPIIGDIKAKLQLFEKVTFSHVGRQGNAAAHALAKLHTQFQMPKYWIEEAPPEVEQISIYDLR
ncbi:hypothetical protein V6N13_028240 [Hibiscus sabdariffa]